MIQADYLLIYITAKDTKEAKKIGKLLIEKRLAACVNILPKMQSIYRFKGKIEESEEVLVLAKTRQQLFSSIEQAVSKIHSYETPSIIAINIAEGYPPFMRWIKEETTD